MIEVISGNLKVTLSDAALGKSREDFMDAMKLAGIALYDLLHPEYFQARLDKYTEMLNNG